MAIRNPESSLVPGDQQAEPLSKKRKSILFPSLALLFSVVLLMIAWWIATRPTLGPGSRFTRFTPPAVTQPTLTKEQIQTFFDQEIRPQLDQYSQRNQEAVERAADQIISRIDA